MTLTVRQFRLLLLTSWLLLVSNIAAPGYLTFWMPHFGAVDLPSLLQEARPDA